MSGEKQKRKHPLIHVAAQRKTGIDHHLVIVLLKETKHVENRITGHRVTKRKLEINAEIFLTTKER